MVTGKRHREPFSILLTSIRHSNMRIILFCCWVKNGMDTCSGDGVWQTYAKSCVPISWTGGPGNDVDAYF